MSAGRRPVVTLVAVLALGVAAGFVAREQLQGSASASLAPPALRALPAVAAPPPPRSAAIAALGRLEPKDGVYRVAGPSLAAVVVGRLLVAEGDGVEAGQLLAELDTLAIHRAELARWEAELANARAELARSQRLHRGAVVSDALRDRDALRVQVARAELARATAEVERAEVRSPVAGEVIEIHAFEGERVGPDGIVEIGRTDQMYAIAEVYESDVPRLRVGQRARIRSPALPGELGASVERVMRKVGKLDVLGTDPVARNDARVVEVELRLDESAAAAGLTNLQVEVLIEP